MIIRLPAASDYTNSVLANAFMVITRAFGRVQANDEPKSEDRWVSPNGTVYKVTVSNAGAFVFTVI